MGRAADIRPMRAEDLHDVFNLGSRLFTGSGSLIRPWNETVVADELTRGLESSLSAIAKKKIIGFLIGTIDGREAGIFWTGVDPAFAEPGLQERLIISFIDGLAGKNVVSICIEAPMINSQLIDLCGKIGFTETGHVISMERILTKQ